MWSRNKLQEVSDSIQKLVDKSPVIEKEYTQIQIDTVDTLDEIKKFYQQKKIVEEMEGMNNEGNLAPIDRYGRKKVVICKR